MEKQDYESLSQAIAALVQKGFEEDFKAGEDHFIALRSKREYKPQELEIELHYRFEGMSNPADDSILFAIKANDGTKGTLVMAYAAEHNQNVELIKQIPGSSL